MEEPTGKAREYEVKIVVDDPPHTIYTVFRDYPLGGGRDYEGKEWPDPVPDFAFEIRRSWWRRALWVVGLFKR